jgi:hypothetical protein
MSSICDRFNQLRLRGIAEVKGIFSEKELNAIVIAMLSHAWCDRAEYLDQEIAPNVEDISLEDAMLDSETERKALLAKLKGLTYAQHIWVAEYIRQYWIDAEGSEQSKGEETKE